MSVPLVVNGVTYNYPQQFDTNWGPTLTNWSTAVTNGMLQTSGVNAVSLLKSATANPSATGFLRLANTDTISWRNAGNSADLPLGVNGSNQLTFNGSPIGATVSLTNSHIFVGNVSNQPTDVAMSGDATIANTGALTIANGAINNAKVNASAAIAVSKLAALTASRIVTSDGSGFLTTTASPTLTELGYVGGVTSAIQTQLNTLTTNQGNYLPLAGGTMSGAISMASHKITSLTQGTTTGDAISFPVGTAQLAANAVTQIVSSTSGNSSNNTNITSATITTSGNPVLILATANISGFSPSNVGNVGAIFIDVTRGSTGLAGGVNGFSLSTASSGTIIQVAPSVITVDTPGAGTYTYNLSYSFTVTSPTISRYSLILIEIKA